MSYFREKGCMWWMNPTQLENCTSLLHFIKMKLHLIRKKRCKFLPNFLKNGMEISHLKKKHFILKAWYIVTQSLIHNNSTPILCSLHCLVILTQDNFEIERLITFSPFHGCSVIKGMVLWISAGNTTPQMIRQVNKSPCIFVLSKYCYSCDLRYPAK